MKGITLTKIIVVMIGVLAAGLVSQILFPLITGKGESI